jgi:short-subunit dehydrogenase
MASKNPLTILVTGATAGIGRHAAVALARSGHRVIATGRKESALAALRAEVSLETVVLDVTDARSISDAVRAVNELTAGVGVDVLVNNAGYGLVAPLELVTDADLRAQFETNVFGLMAVTRAFLPKMRERGRGRILNVSSMGGRVTFPFMGAYNATKYAVESLSDALRNEVAPFGIDVVLIEPGAIHTEFSDRAMQTAERYKSDDSPYRVILAKADAIRERVESTAVGPEHVVRSITRAIEARRPRARYVVPFRTHLFLALFALLPTRVTDWLLRSIFGLSRMADTHASPKTAAALNA